MPPEFVNRMDDVIAFAALDRAVIADIARKEVAGAQALLQARGFTVEIDPAVAALIGEAGYDPAYGARHLQRNVESMLLAPIARAGDRSLRVFVRDERIVVEPARDSAPAA
jgi:ATP-dependent Clp protease ATP-binding subunit ClpC